MNQYQRFLTKYGFPALKEISQKPEVIKTVKRDIPDLGEMGLQIITDIGEKKSIFFEGCLGDEACIDVCPENALEIQKIGDEFQITIDLALCDGVACRRCERICSEKCFDLIKIITL